MHDRHGSLWRRSPLVRKLRAMGRDVRLMAPQFVKPYVMTNKSDPADVEAIHTVPLVFNR